MPQKSRHIHVEKQSGQNNQMQFLMLALFLLLLAFFIAMTAGAEYDDNRLVPLREGLDKVFPVNRLQGQGRPVVVEDAKDVRGDGHTLSDVENLFTMEFFPFGVNVENVGGQFEMQISRKDLEGLLNLTDESVLTVMERQSFFARLAAVVQPSVLSGDVDDDLARGYQLHVTRSVPDIRDFVTALNRQEKGKVILSLERYIEAFKRKGIAPDRLSSRVEQGAYDGIMLVFVPQKGRRK